MVLNTSKLFIGLLTACMTLLFIQTMMLLLSGNTRPGVFVRVERWPLFVEIGPAETAGSQTLDVSLLSSSLNHTKVTQGSGAAHAYLPNSNSLDKASLHKDAIALPASRDAAKKVTERHLGKEKLTAAGGSDWFEPMIIGLDYREQIANALASLFDLQCWARTVNISKVVEPHVKAIRRSGGSVFHYLPNLSSNVLKFKDLLNVTHWNEMSAQHNFATLVPAEHFLKHATREIVFVQIVYRFHPLYCLQDLAIMRNDWYKVLTAEGFHIVKKVCIDFRKVQGHVVTEEDFLELIFKDVNRNVSVLFNVWEGIRANNAFRVALKGSRCSDLLFQMANVKLDSLEPSEQVHVHRKSSAPVLPSQHISKLVEQFLTEFLSKERFMAIMVRTEKMNFKMFRNISHNACITNILSDWKGMKNASNITKTLLFSDTDKHGSITLYSSQAKTFTSYIMNSIGAEQNVNMYLERMAASNDSVLLAVLTREIVARATCMVSVGGGLFQRQTLNMFAHNHKEEELCYSVRDGFCRSQFIQSVGDGEHLANYLKE